MATKKLPMEVKKKIGFIYLDDIHHIYHFISVFAELYKRKEYILEIITFDIEQDFLIQELKKYKIPKNVIVKAPTFFYRKLLNKLRGRKLPNPIFVLSKNKKKLMNFDALIFNVPQHKYLIKSRKVDKPKFIQLGHGPGVGTYQFDEKFSSFDLITVSGKKDYDLYRKNIKFNNTNIKICGYQKFDAIDKKRITFFKNNNLTVLYNPHFKTELTSFHKKGFEILEFFYNHKEYNLIFAPHINLFNKKGFLKKDSFDKKFLNSDNILVDFGSINSVNMSYTNNADIYLGDVSSQLYEFLITPRPCIFINASNIDWQENVYYKNWETGKVISNIEDLDIILKTSNVWKNEYTDLQIKLIKNVFSFDRNLTASERIMEEILKII